MGGFNYYFKQQKRIIPMAVKQRRKPAWIGWLIIGAGAASVAMAFAVVVLLVMIGNFI
jgi:fumarate reductase subunit D